MSASDAANAVASITSTDPANVLVRTSREEQELVELEEELVLRGFKIFSIDARTIELHNLIIPGFVRMTLAPDLRRADVLILTGLQDATEETYLTLEGLIKNRFVNDVPVPHLASVIVVCASTDDKDHARIEQLESNGNVIFTTEM